MIKLLKIAIFFFLISPFFPTSVLANGEDVHLEEQVESFALEQFLTQTSLLAIGVAGAVTLLLVIFAVLFRQASESAKRFLFLGIVVPIILATFYLSATTIYLNLVSASRGPVHWHADFEIFVCGKKIDLVDPKGLSNRIGTSTFHEHGDDRIHIEGVVVSHKNVTLGKFFQVTGGRLTKNSLTLPTNQGILHVDNGDLCENNISGQLQVFLYQTHKKSFIQKKLTNFPQYAISPHSLVPPGDCLIIEFGQEKSETENLCQSYKTALKKGEVHER